MRKASHEKTLHYTIGEAGGQIGEIFKQNQYDVIAYNTAKADMDKLKQITDKRLIGITEGSGKDRKLSAKSFDDNIDKIRTAVTQDMSNKEVAFIYTSMSGGTGSGSAIRLAKLIHQLGKKAIIVAVKPVNGEIGKAENNYLQFLAEFEKEKNDLVLDMFENEFDYVKINKYIYETIDNFLNPVGESITTFDFMDSLKAFRSGYCVMATGKTKEIIVNSMFELNKSETCVLISQSPQSVDGYQEMTKRNYGYLDRQYYEYRVQENPKWTILIGGLQLPIDTISTLAKEVNQKAQLLNAKKDSLTFNILGID